MRSFGTGFVIYTVVNVQGKSFFILEIILLWIKLQRSDLKQFFNKIKTADAIFIKYFTKNIVNPPVNIYLYKIN